jgi:hypothetical protein
MSDTAPVEEIESLERFLRETCKHEMTVLRDDGLYRHLRFQEPGSGFYWYDLITWPGRLVVCGDAGDWMFSRTSDMFLFFESQHGGINPHYWGEKLRGAKPGREGARKYSEEAFKDFREWDWSFLWCCWAIVKGIEQYRAYNAVVSGSAPMPTENPR